MQVIEVGTIKARAAREQQQRPKGKRTGYMQRLLKATTRHMSTGDPAPKWLAADAESVGVGRGTGGVRGRGVASSPAMCFAMAPL